MAYVLLIDPNDVARKALQGVLARGSHRLKAVSTVAEGWEFLLAHLCVDVVFVELQLGSESGLTLIDRMRRDPLLKLLPVVVYTAGGDRETVRRSMELKVQNFLVKPYRDDVILAEMAKALANPWRNRHFEEPRSFCAMMGYTPAGLAKALQQLADAVELAAGPLAEAAASMRVSNVIYQIDELSASAEAAGAWGIVEVLGMIREKAERGDWAEFTASLAGLTLARRLIVTQLNPDLVPDDFATEEERNEAEEAKARAVWFDAVVEQRCPVVTWPQIAQEIETLKGCPVIDSVAASFQMSATGHPSSLAPLMDLAEEDPGLSAHLLIAANLLRRNGDLDPEPIENPRICISLLGELKLAAMASGIPTAEARMMQLPPCNWTEFWMFQVGVAHMARYTCGYLEFNSLEPRAYAAGLMHDLGKLLLLRLHPYGFQAVLAHARANKIPVAEAEKLLLGCTTQAMAAHFAEKHGLLPAYANVMRWHTDPALATADAVLVASVSLARELCRQNQVGWSGETTTAPSQAIADTPGWAILKERIFPSFDLAKFEDEAHAACRELKLELHGQVSPARV